MSTEWAGWVARFDPAAPPAERLRIDGAPPAAVGDEAWRVWVDGGLVAAEGALDLWRRHGERSTEHLRGPFVLLAEDRRAGRLTAVRDHLGLEPLFYTERGGVWFLSSRLDLLARHPDVLAAVDRVVLAEWLLDRWGEPEETIFAGVRRLPGGCLLTLDRVGGRVRRYWDPLPADRPVEWIDDHVPARFETALEDAVGRCLSAGPAAVFLSGGLDSVSVAALAAEEASPRGEPPLALSLLFPHPEIDEAETQRHVAAALGLPQVARPFDELAGPEGFLRAALDACRGWPWPLMNAWLPLYLRLGRLGVERGARVLLTGTGGDEWLAVTPYLAADLWRRGSVPELWRLFGAYHRSQRLPRRRIAGNLVWRFGLRALALAAADALARRVAPSGLARLRARRQARRLPGWAAPDPRLAAELDRREEARGAHLAWPVESFYVREMKRGLTHPLVHLEHEEYAHAGRRLGARWLHPYLDPDLVELLARVPPRQLLAGGRSKGVVRELLGRRYPELKVESQRKAHVDRFFRERMRAEGPALAAETGAPEALAELGIVAAGPAAAFLRRALAGDRPRDLHRAWQLLHHEAWLRSLTADRTSLVR